MLVNVKNKNHTINCLTNKYTTNLLDMTDSHTVSYWDLKISMY